MSIASDLAFPAVPLLLWGVVALGACAAILWALLTSGLAWRLATDIPNDRSLHTRPTPRVGGWGIVPVTVVLIWLAAPALWLPALAAALLAALSQIDDRRGLPARIRFGGHAAAVAALIAIYPAEVPWWALAAMAVLLVWLVNLYNFMDGSDGLAGGMALFGFGGYAIAASVANHPDFALALACVIVAGAAAGFLLFNFHPARIFLGDAGSIPLGFLAGALGYWGWREGVWPVWFPALCFAPFIGDASVTLLKRLVRGEKFWQAHREHYYQRLVQSGLGHASTAWIWYLFMAAGIMLAVWALQFAVLYQWLVVVVWAAVLAVAGLCIDCRWRRYASRSRQS
ncbi:Glycosyl transferase, family 4, conserved region [Paraburkholderia ribeironis]|uniref:Glycosyl transferase, family 4, conserved region n=1 Tax=Paraburkholderia ribeironis TaxID=1247936 RepID=A0A1N7RNK9_9BURK|nr:glycosyltransferase family 4 protein [Paraburkholderia ribeironis]SIT36301.1 Glycosyl transferase, family 4, conserved region [Paraburkholderia ribeironis]